ncbi:MAG TPA: RNA-binding protein [bacterium]|nr:RNA-binding protein [bacterium]
MGNRLYVGNLSFKTTEEGLRDLFARDGKQVTDCRVITDRATGRSRGFGFVEMASEEDAQKAIELLDNFELDGRALKVNFAREKENDRGGGQSRRSESW